MSVITDYFVQCDECYAEYAADAHSRHWIRRLARQAGWTRRKCRDGVWRDLCPKCRKTVK